MTDLRELEKRLEEATESSWELDRDIGLLIGGWSYEPDDSEIARKYPERRWLRDSEGNVFSDHPGSVSDEAFTDSLDAAIALVERVLPSNRDDGRVWLQLLDDAVTTALASDAKPEDMARLVCITLIRALIAKGDRHD